jgi:hypothetical protein
VVRISFGKVNAWLALDAQRMTETTPVLSLISSIPSVSKGVSVVVNLRLRPYPTSSISCGAKNELHELGLSVLYLLLLLCVPVDGLSTSPTHLAVLHFLAWSLTCSIS